MATIREWLDTAGFDWNSGKIIWQRTEYNEYPGWESPVDACFIPKDHHILDEVFDDGFGGSECPRFIAEDDKTFYFPAQYDGTT